jgi:hypothetical protein
MLLPLGKVCRTPGLQWHFRIGATLVAVESPNSRGMEQMLPVDYRDP